MKHPEAHTALRSKILSKEFFIAPGLQDMIAAVLADRLNFDAVYASGYWMTASAYGLPDAGIATYTQMLDRVTTLVGVCNAPVIADADTGYGGLINVLHTVRGYEAAGVSVIQLEDQEFPKKCGHTPHKRVVPIDVMVRRIRVAVEARTAPEKLLIAARTDARQSEGLDGVLRRLEAYRNAGADILFPEALASEEEMNRTCLTFDLPIMANMAHGGNTPILGPRTLQQIGFAFAIYPSMTSLAAAAAMERCLKFLWNADVSGNPQQELYDFKKFCSLIGFEEVWDLERRFGH